jgi:hypothetical protein
MLISKKTLLLLFLVSGSFGAKAQRVSVIDFVKIKNNKQAEALYYYQQNWKLYRDIALKNKFITSYKLLKTNADSTGNFDLLLLTEYPDSVALSQGEVRFTQIIKENRPNGPLLLNTLKPADFRQNMFFKTSKTVYSSDY